MICGAESTVAAADGGQLDFPAEQRGRENRRRKRVERGVVWQGQRELAQCALSYS